jgi:hypothetical protein
LGIHEFYVIETVGFYHGLIYTIQCTFKEYILTFISTIAYADKNN